MFHAIIVEIKYQRKINFIVRVGKECFDKILENCGIISSAGIDEGLPDDERRSGLNLKKKKCICNRLYQCTEKALSSVRITIRKKGG